MIAPAPVASAPEAAPNGPPVPYRVLSRKADTADIATVVLEPVGAALPVFEAGQFAMIYAFGVGEIPISISGIDTPKLQHTIQAVGASSSALFNLTPGQMVGLRGPFGTSWDITTAAGRDLMIVAGGLGLPPLRPALLQALATPERYGHINILLGARNPGMLLFTEQYDEWRQNARVEVTVDVADDAWTGDVGLVTSLIDRAEYDPANTEAFVVGPEVMIRATARDLAGRGIDPSHIRVSLERNMRCGVAQCGHCQCGSVLVCRDGAVLTWDRVEHLLAVREL